MARKQDHNLKFLKGGVVFFVLISIVVIFTYYAITETIKENNASSECLIILSEDFKDTNLSFYANDSLLYKGEPVNPDTTFLAPCTGKEVKIFVYTSNSVLLDSCTLEKGGNYRLKYNDGDIEAIKQNRN